MSNQSDDKPRHPLMNGIWRLAFAVALYLAMQAWVIWRTFQEAPPPRQPGETIVRPQ